MFSNIMSRPLTYFDILQIDVIKTLFDYLDDEDALTLCDVSRRIKELFCKNTKYFIWKYENDFFPEKAPILKGDLEFEAFENYMDRRQIRRILESPHSIGQKMLDIAAFNDGMYFSQFGMSLAHRFAQNYGINEVQDKNIDKYFQAIIPYLEIIEDDIIFDDLRDLRNQYQIQFTLPDDLRASPSLGDGETFSGFI